MEELGGGGATPLRHQQRASPSSNRFLGIVGPQSTSAAVPVELSEHDIFNTPSGSPSSPSPVYYGSSPSSVRSADSRGQYGILAALNDNLRARSGSGSEIRPVFNHKASTSASLSSSTSNSPSTAAAAAPAATSRMMIPRRHPPPPPIDRMRLRHQSAPVNVPLMPAAMMRRARELENVLSEEEMEEEEEEMCGVILPPHEILAARHSPALSSSVLEGAGRTLKGRDLRQVRNAIWRKTGFLD